MTVYYVPWEYMYVLLALTRVTLIVVEFYGALVPDVTVQLLQKWMLQCQIAQIGCFMVF